MENSIQQNSSAETINAKYKGFEATVPAPSQETRDSLWIGIAMVAAALGGVALGSSISKSDE